MRQVGPLSERQWLLQLLASPPAKSQVFWTTQPLRLQSRRACRQIEHVAAFQYCAMVRLKEAAVLLGLRQTNWTKNVRARELRNLIPE